VKPAFPDLPIPKDLILDDPFWRYTPPQFSAAGEAHLRIWTTDAGQRLAMVTELDLGPSITNSIEHIWQTLIDEHSDELVLLEHWPPPESLGEEHLDQVVVQQGTPHWRRIWPLPDDNPHAQAFGAWMNSFGPAAGIRA
jgi:hypothetical protein